MNCDCDDPYEFEHDFNFHLTFFMKIIRDKDTKKIKFYLMRQDLCPLIKESTYDVLNTLRTGTIYIQKLQRKCFKLMTTMQDGYKESPVNVDFISKLMQMKITPVNVASVDILYVKDALMIRLRR